MNAIKDNAEIRTDIYSDPLDNELFQFNPHRL